MKQLSDLLGPSKGTFNLMAGSLPPLAAGLAAVALTAHTGPLAASEGRFLALILTSTLLALTPVALAGSKYRAEWLVLPLLSALTIVAVPLSAARGAAVSLLLVAGCVYALARGGERLGEAFDLGVWIPAAVGVQLLFREPMLLHPDVNLRWLVVLFALPSAAVLLAGRLAGRLATRRGAFTGVAVLAAIVVVAGGFTGTGVLCLLAITLADELGRRSLRTRLVGTLLLGGLLLLWSPTRGLVLLVGAMSLFLGRAWAAALLVAAGALYLVAEPRPWSSVASGLAILPLVLPLGLWGFSAAVQAGDHQRPSPRFLVFCSVALAVVGLRALNPAHALLAPVILLVLASLSSDSEATASSPRNAPGVARAALAWLLFLLGWSAIRAGYPWLRVPLVDDSLRALGVLKDGAKDGVWVLIPIALLGVVAAVLSRPSGSLAPRTRALGWLAGFATLLFVLTPHLGRQWVLLDSPPRKLTAAARSFSLVTDLLEPTQTRLALDTTLAHSASLAPGTPVLTVRLSGPHGVSREWSLRSGLDTGEWAAAREQLVAPSAWTSWVDGTGHFFGQRYRKVLEIGIVEPGSRLDIELVEGLPEDTAATLYRVTMSRSRNSEAHALTGRALG